MSTTMANAKTVSRKWYVLDAADVPLGRLAAKAAVLLRGKHKPDFTPNVDCGDHVIIVNAAKAVLTGNKLQKKMYYHHTGWIGNLKTVSASDMMKNNPEKAMMLAVKGMLPDSVLGRNQLRRLRVYAGPEHKMLRRNRKFPRFKFPR